MVRLGVGYIPGGGGNIVCGFMFGVLHDVESYMINLKIIDILSHILVPFSMALLYLDKEE